MTEQEIFSNNGRKLVGKIVTTERGSYFVQVKHARRGDCVNIGMRFPEKIDPNRGRI